MSDAALRRPILAAEAARLFALWANVEYTLGAMSSLLIGDNTGLALLDQLRSRNQKLDGIRAAAADRISHDETRELLKPLFRLINKAAEPRNKFAHCLWGTLEELPEAVLLTDPISAQKAIRHINLATGRRETGSHSPDHVLFEKKSKLDHEAATQIIRILRDGTEVWHHPDFCTPLFILKRAVIALTQYSIAISEPPHTDVARRSRNQLLDLLTDTEQYY